MLAGPAGHLHVESRVVDQDQRIGSPCGHILAALAHLAADRAEVLQHLHDAEERGLAVVLAEVLPAARLGHAVAAPEAELRLGIGLSEPFDQVGAVQVARRLPGYEVVFHLFALWFGFLLFRCRRPA